MKEIIKLSDVVVDYYRNGNTVRAVAGVDLTLNSGEILGLVGESGCGKSTLGKAIVGILQPSQGEITFDGQIVKKLTRGQRPSHFRNLQMIFQDPYSSLNPRHTIGSIIAASYEIQKITPDQGVKRAVQELMERVGLNPEHYNRYPHEFSGGQRQRIGIARALALKPKFIVCDEPVSALDVSIQAQVINLLDDLRDDFGLSYLFIAHDLSVVQHISQRVAVMYLGKIMELAPTEDLYKSPHHPYTKALLSAIPIPDPVLERKREQIILSGDIPNPVNPPSGCVFNTRCWKAQDKCRTTEPAIMLIGASQVACHFPD